MKVLSKKPDNPTVGDLLVWHNPQVGQVAGLYVPVANLEEAQKVRDLLATYDLWQFENRIKGDYASASGLITFEGIHPEADPNDDGWYEWMNDDGYDINELERLIPDPTDDA